MASTRGSQSVLARGQEKLSTFVAAALAVAVSGFAAFFTGQPLIFSSLGPTAYLFFESPMSRGGEPA